MEAERQSCCNNMKFKHSQGIRGFGFPEPHIFHVRRRNKRAFDVDLNVVTEIERRLRAHSQLSNLSMQRAPMKWSKGVSSLLDSVFQESCELSREKPAPVGSRPRKSWEQRKLTAAHVVETVLLLGYPRKAVKSHVQENRGMSLV